MDGSDNAGVLKVKDRTERPRKRETNGARWQPVSSLGSGQSKASREGDRAPGMQSVANCRAWKKVVSGIANRPFSLNSRTRIRGA